MISPANISKKLPEPLAAQSGRWTRAGKVRPAILLWALGVPIPIILVVLLIRGCM
jgi:hypothetical protein